VLIVLLLTMVIAPAAIAQTDFSGEINFYYLDDRPESRTNWEMIVAGFNETYPNVTVNLIGGPATEGWDGYAQGAARSIAGGQSLDLIYVAVEGVATLVDLGVLRSLNDYIAADQEAVANLMDDVDPALVEPFIIEGNQYLLPHSWNSMLMYYNTARFDEAGIEAPAEDWTWEDFLAAAQALTEDTDGDSVPNRYGFDIGGGPFGLEPWFASNGGSFMSEDWCTPLLNSPEVVETFDFLRSLVYDYQVAPTPGSTANLFEQFQNGDISMFAAGRWMVGIFMAADFDDYDIAYMPGNPDSGTVVGVDGYAMFNSTQNADATWEFIKYLTSESVQQTLVGAEDAPASNVPARRSVASALENFPPDHADRFYGSLSFGNGANMLPSPKNASDVYGALGRAFTNIFSGEVSVEDALNAAQSEITSSGCS